jgi:hypothetical protein
MVSECIAEQEESQATRENGSMTSSMEKVGKSGKMAVSISGCMLFQRKKEEACTFGLIRTDTWEGGKITRFTGI